jgi:hypothetical protein
MTSRSQHEPASPAAQIDNLSAAPGRDGQLLAAAVIGRERGSAEGRYLSGPGKPLARQVTSLQEEHAVAAVADVQAQEAVSRAEDTIRDQQDKHRGGDRPWLLRCLIAVAFLAEAVTAYVAMQALVDSQPLAFSLSVLTAGIGTGMACLLANHRLNRLRVPLPARALEAVFVSVLTILRYESLATQGSTMLAAAGAAALAALVSTLGLAGIEEIVMETRTLTLSLSTLQLAWTRWRRAAAAARLAAIRASIAATAATLQQDFLDFLLRSESLPLDQARRRAAALAAALTAAQARP